MTTTKTRRRKSLSKRRIQRTSIFTFKPASQTAQPIQPAQKINWEKRAIDWALGQVSPNSIKVVHLCDGILALPDLSKDVREFWELIRAGAYAVAGYKLLTKPPANQPMQQHPIYPLGVTLLPAHRPDYQGVQVYLLSPTRS